MRLDAYLARIGIARPERPTLVALRDLHVAHLAAFTFDNLTIQRGGSIALDLDSLERKFIDGGAGGYCFEQNILFGAVLRELGFDVTTLLGRVGPRDRNALNHMILRVDLGGERWIADVGFGAEGSLEPLPLHDGARIEQRGLFYSMARDGDEWVASFEGGGGAEEMYRFTDVAYTAADVEMANHFAATHPASIFRKSITIQRATPEERLILRPKVITRYRDGAKVDREVEPAEFRRHARELFGIELGEEELLFERG